MQAVEIYTTPTCPFCQRAKHLLRSKNVVFSETNVSTDHALRQKMSTRAGGRTSVPQIFIGGMHVGGCDDLHALERQGKLDALLAR